jgi:perosamine synthetase
VGHSGSSRAHGRRPGARLRYDMPDVKTFGIVRPPGVGGEVERVLGSGQVATGPQVEEFRRGIAGLLGTTRVVTTNNMSSAMAIALRIAGVAPGDLVATTSFACMGTNAPIANAGAIPSWIDVDPETGLMSPDDLRRRLTPDTRAVILYHLAGYPAPALEIAAICREAGVCLIEDCDNAMLATVDGRPVGSFGDFAILSFYPNRMINAGDGGAIACRAEEDFLRALRLVRYGLDPVGFRDARGQIKASMDVPEIGWAATMSNLCSAIGLGQVASAADRVEIGRQRAARYGELLGSSRAVRAVPVQAGCSPAYWVYLVLAEEREALLHALRGEGIQATMVHDLTHRYAGFQSPGRDLPGTQEFFSRVLGLPCGWWMTDSDVRSVAGLL